jgi:hypothetical protein
VQGDPGATGSAGPQGAQGDPGPQGASGTNGTNGTNGAAGPPGPQGPTGATGASGTPGAQGAAGPTGPQGPAGGGVAAWAVVAGNGTLVRSTNVTNATRTGVGEYELTINRNILACAYIGSFGDPASATSNGGFVRTRQDPGGANNLVLVTAYNKEASTRDEDFHLMVVC